jgi:hypothetical protein
MRDGGHEVVNEVRFNVIARGRPGNFGVPQWVRDQLGIGDDERLHLTIDGDLFPWEGDITLGSREQVYAVHREPHTEGLRKIAPYQPLTVVATLPKVR